MDKLATAQLRRLIDEIIVIYECDGFSYQAAQAC